MLNLFKDKQLNKILCAIDEEDELALAKLLRKNSPEKLISQQIEQSVNLLQQAIISHKPKQLKLLLQHHANFALPITQAEGYLQLALQQENSLPLLNILLQFELNEDPQPLLDECFTHCSEQQLMLHLSLLLNAGARLTDAIFIQALNSEQRPLIHFLIQNGANMPENFAAITSSEETLNYAKKCVEDRKIREMFL